MTEELAPKMTREDANAIRDKVQRNPTLIKDVDPAFGLYCRAYECIDTMDKMQGDFNYYQRYCKIVDLVKRYWQYKTNLSRSDPWLDSVYTQVLNCIIENLTGALPF
ncbi:hypothetical protein [uncultured Duncaniella sp.]|uniref:hypothetical protein n=1 Tax=uncultured Duncaniella sp. TaxID=2768039 RepID=UPI00260B04FD|nr:hypothetical protein [uncultured Duncaniella sp.]